MSKLFEKSNGLIKSIAKKNLLQQKYYDNFSEEMTQDEWIGLESLIKYYENKGEDVESLSESYLKFIENIMEEQFYFKQYGEYRCSSAKEVEEQFYCNVSYMKQYMIGLALSTYLLDSHRKCMRWYKEKLEEYKEGGTWLEIGPGHGEHFITAIQNTNYSKYLGVDISKTCVEMCKEMVKYTCCDAENKNICLEQMDFFAYEGSLCDSVVIGEVLEHVEQPQLFLNKIWEITHPKSFIYITTVTNCPQKDHIYLFHSTDEIEEMISKCGFEVIDSLFVPTNGYSMEKAIKKKATINVAYILRKVGK